MKLVTVVDSAIADQVVQMILNTGAIYEVPLSKLPDFTPGPPPETPYSKRMKFLETLKKKKVSYDEARKIIQFVGLITPIEKASLINDSADLDYQAAIIKLFDRCTHFIEQSKIFMNQNLIDFISPSEIETELLTSSTDALGIDQKFTYLLKRLLPYVRDKSSNSLVKQSSV